MYLPALAEDDGLADLPDIGLDTFLQDGLDLCEQQLPFAEANIQLSAQPITKHNIQSMPSLDSAASSSGVPAFLMPLSVYSRGLHSHTRLSCLNAWML